MATQTLKLKGMAIHKLLLPPPLTLASSLPLLTPHQRHSTTTACAAGNPTTHVANPPDWLANPQLHNNTTTAQYMCGPMPPSLNGKQNSKAIKRRAKPAVPTPLQAVSLCDSQEGVTYKREWDPLSDSDEGLPRELCALADPMSSVALPPPGTFSPDQLDNWRLDKLVATLGRSRSTWRRSLVLYEWLKASNKPLDDRLCTTLIRVCADHSDAVSALSVYEWMRAPRNAGGAALRPTTYTYTAAMRAALGANLLDRALQVWGDCQVTGVPPDSRMCITFIEVCTRLGQIDRALQMYTQMRSAPPNSSMAPSVHAYTASMRAATEGGRWARALDIWADLKSSGCQATGHAYAAAISACAAGQQWQQAVALFDDMAGVAGIRPDVVSCTALVTALASAGEADKAEAVVQWMLAIGLKPNVRTYTALLTAMGNAQQWMRAVDLLFTMQIPESGGVAPNAYTYSALLKALGEHGQWQLAEALFDHLEQQVLGGGLGPAGLEGLGLAPGSNSSVTISKGIQAQLLTARTRLATLAARAEGLQRQQQDAQAAQLAQLQTSSAAQLADLQAMSASLRTKASPAAVSPPLPLGRDESSTSDSGGEYLRDPGSSSTMGSQASLETLNVARLEGFPVAARCSNDGSVSSELSSSSSIGSQLSTASVAFSKSSMGSMGSNDESRSWASPAQLNGLSLDLQLPQSQSQPQQQQQLNAPPPRSLSTEPPLQQAQEANLSANVSPTPTPPSSPTQPPGLQPSGFSLFSSQPVPASNSTAQQPPQTPFPPIFLQQCATTYTSHTSTNAPTSATGPVLNEVVCGALMLAYERAGKWRDAVGVLQRARSLGLRPNTVMLNTAISAAGKAGQLGVAEALLESAAAPDPITFEAFIAACGIAGAPDKAEQTLTRMQAQGFRPREYAFCGLIAAYSLAGQHEKALAVRMRARREGMQPSVHVYNASLAACERVGRVEMALELLQSMQKEGVEPNFVTHQLMAVVGRQGVQSVEQQQVAAATLSAICAAAGSLLIKVGMF